MNPNDTASGDTDPAFRRIAIVGLGLIGGSIAMAARRRWPAISVVGIDRPEIGLAAISRGAVTGSSPDLDAIAGADLVVLATPVSAIPAILGRLNELVGSGTIVTDVGSTKRSSVEAARRLAPGVAFVGGHPMAGAATSGFESATVELFEGRTWLLTPTSDCLPESVARLGRFISALGAHPRFVDVSTHDRLMAPVSHLPQVAVSALMLVVGEMAGTDGLGLAGAGLKDTTRLASSPADVWADICATNADHIGEALDRYIEVLGSLRCRLSERGAVEQVFNGAREWRRRLEAATEAGDPPAQPLAGRS